MNKKYPAHEDLENWYYQRASGFGQKSPKFDNSFLINEFQALLHRQQRDAAILMEVASGLETSLLYHGEGAGVIAKNLLKKINERLKGG